MPYQRPVQARAIQSQNNFLSALDELLKEKSFEETTIEEIAERASQTKSAFLRRFGTKEQALFVLFEIYADEASALMAEAVATLSSTVSLEQTFYDMSYRFDQLLNKHFSANRAMNEYVKRQLESHDLTKKIFGECIAMMKSVQSAYSISSSSDVGAYAAAQLLVSIDFHYVMKAMPALPADPEVRHQLIAELLVVAIQK